MADLRQLLGRMAGAPSPSDELSGELPFVPPQWRMPLPSQGDAYSPVTPRARFEGGKPTGGKMYGDAELGLNYRREF